MEAWRKVFRIGVAPLLPDRQLQVLLDGLERDDPRLVQGATTTPPPMQCVLDWPVEAACLIGYPFAFNNGGEKTVGETEEFFARLCFEIDQRMGEPAAVRYLLNWFDDEPRDSMRQKLSEEVRLELERRGEGCHPDHRIASAGSTPSPSISTGLARTNSPTRNWSHDSNASGNSGQ